MVLESLTIKINTSTKEIGLMGKKMEKEKFLPQMDNLSTMATGKMDSLMDMANLMTKMAILT